MCDAHGDAVEMSRGEFFFAGGSFSRGTKLVTLLVAADIVAVEAISCIVFIARQHTR